VARASNPILVTGAHRSGTSWVGRMIALSPAVLYIHEPFNVSDGPGPGVCGVTFENWFTYIDATNERRYYAPLHRTIVLDYDLAAALRSIRRPGDLCRVAREYLRFTKHARRRARPLLKDPLALLSAEWLAMQFNMSVVVVIRHPAAFVSSIKRLNWPHPFEHFARQERLMDTLLRPFASQVQLYATTEQTLLDQAILLWKILHHAIAEYQQRHPDWIFIRHEDLARDYLNGFRNLYRCLDLEFTDSAAAAVEEYCNSANATEGLAPYALRRNSRSSIWSWQRHLTAPEIARIRNSVEDLSRVFYSDEDWQIPAREA
jgi:hypothetical protein